MNIELLKELRCIAEENELTLVETDSSVKITKGLLVIAYVTDKSFYCTYNHENVIGRALNMKLYDLLRLF